MASRIQALLGSAGVPRRALLGDVDLIGTGEATIIIY
jgi:hypothetical protein